MARTLKDPFFKWLQKDPINLLAIISQYDCLAIHFSDGKKLKVYFKGCRILTISDKIITDNEVRFKPLVLKYYTKVENKDNLVKIINRGVNINNLQEYLDCVIGFLSRRNPHAEEALRQEIARVNNRSSVANDTDYFIVDEEYEINGSRFDLVAIKWLSDKNIRKAFNSKRSSLEIVVFELKQGLNAVGGSEKSKSEQADLKKHYSDFQTFVSDEARLSEFKLDIVKMFVQQASLKGFFNDEDINGLKHVRALSEPWNDKEIQDIADIIPVKFGLILSDYKQKSDRLREQVKQIKGDFLFARSSFMGYGLYEDSILNREQLLELLK